MGKKRDKNKRAAFKKWIFKKNTVAAIKFKIKTCGKRGRGKSCFKNFRGKKSKRGGGETLVLNWKIIN